jgi:hypothetical protein
MTISESWKKYVESGIIATDQEVLTMMQDVVAAKNLLEKIGGEYYDLATYRLLCEWNSLKDIAFHRDLKNYPQWVTKLPTNV